MIVDDRTTEYDLNINDESSIRALLATIDIKNLPSFVKPILRDPRTIPRHGKKYRYRGSLPNFKSKWKAQISFKGVNYDLGSYNSQRNAGAIYAWVHLILYGEEATQKAEEEGEDAVAAFEQEKFGFNACHTSNNVQDIHSTSITVNENDILLFDGSHNRRKSYGNNRLRNLVDHAIKENGSQKNKDISLSLYTKLKHSDLPPRFLRRSIIDGDWFEVSEEIAVRTIYNMVYAMKNRATAAATPVDMTTRTTATRYMPVIRPLDSLTTSLGSAVANSFEVAQVSTLVTNKLLFHLPPLPPSVLWTDEEHPILLDGFIKYGNDPKTISALLKNKSEYNVRSFLESKKNYNRLLQARNEKIKGDKTIVAAPLVMNKELHIKPYSVYTQEEREIVVDGYTRYSHDSLAISRLLKNRDEVSVRRFLKKHIVWLQTQAKTRRRSK